MTSLRNIYMNKRFNFPTSFLSSGPVKPKRKWGKWLFAGSLIGSSMCGYYIYREIFYTEKEATPTKISLYKALPLKALSRAWGTMNELELPKTIRVPILKWYAKRFGVNLDEAEIQDLEQYSSLGQFFRRRLLPHVRIVDKQHDLVCPSDGRILHFGRLEGDVLEQIKGVTYSVEGFLGPPTWDRLFGSHLRKKQDSKKAAIRGNDPLKLLSGEDSALYHCTIYLAPGDYHGFHSPTEWVISMRRHFPGELLSVNPSVARWLRGLFNLNERVVYVGEWKHGFFCMAPVGATNVGSIQVYFDENLATNKRRKFREVCPIYTDLDFAHRDLGGISLKKGEPFGEFNLGSSLVLIFEAPPEFEFTIEPGQKVLYGQPLGRVIIQEDS